MLHWIQHSSLCTAQIQLCVVSAERGVWRGGHGSDGSSSFAEEHGGRVEALALLLQFTFHLTAPDNSPGCPGLSHALALLSHTLTLLSHALTFLLLGVPGTLHPNPLPGCLVAHQCSERIQAEFFFLPIPFLSFPKSSSLPHHLRLCISFFPLSAQIPQTLSLPLLKHPGICLSLQLLLQKSLSLFRFSLAFYNSSFQSPVASVSCIKSECHISIFRPFRAVLPLASLFLFSFPLSKGFCQTNSKPLCWTQTAGYRHLRAGRCLGEQMGLDELEEKGGFVLWAEEVTLGCWKRGHTWQLWVFLVFKHCGQVLTSGWSNIPCRALLLFLLVCVFLPEHSNCCHIFVWPHTFVQWCNMEKAKFKCLV